MHGGANRIRKMINTVRFAMTPKNIPASGSVDFEARAELATNFIERAVDAITGQPYFDVFHGEPVEFYHDWPDFGDLTARYWEAAVMIGDMIGKYPENTAKMKDLLWSYFEKDGLNYRPETPYTCHSVEMFDQSRTLSALCTGYMANPTEEIADTMRKMVDGIANLTVTEGGYRFIPGGMNVVGKGWKHRATLENAQEVNLTYFLGPMIRCLVKIWEMIDYKPALDLAVDLTKFTVEIAKAIGTEGEMTGHIHSRLATAAGVFSCGRAIGNEEWCNAARKAWDFSRKMAGPCGFIPEVIYQADPMYRSETCTIMDYIDLTLILAMDGDDSKWGEAEKILRNHLIESQLTNTDWATGGPERPRDELSSAENVGERMLGGYCGWSALDKVFAIACKFDQYWVNGDVDHKHYVGKRRLFQNCCGPAGPRAIYLAWSKAIELRDDAVYVNLLVNRRTSDAGVAVREGANSTIEVEVTAYNGGNISVRIPEWTNRDGIIVKKNGADVHFDLNATRLVVKNLAKDDVVMISYPYTIRKENYTVHHTGGYAYEDYVITLKGDSAISVESVGGGLSKEQYDNVCGLEKNPPLYQRSADSVYAPEPEPRLVDAAVDWF